MSREYLTSIFAKLAIAAVTTSGMLALSTQNAGAQAVIATTPFAFTAGNQTFPSGTYEFTLLSQWSLSIRNVDGGSQKFFTVRPEDKSVPGSKGSLTFHKSGGRRNLQAVYVPGTGRTAELLQYAEAGERSKSGRSLASLHTSSGKLQPESKNAPGR